MPAAATVLSSLAETPAIYQLVDDDRDVLAFESCWRTSKKRSHATQQTEPLTTSDQSNQSTDTTASSCQASPQWSNEPLTASELSDDCLLALSVLLPVMEEQVLLNANSTAFDGFTASWDEDRAAVIKLHTLHHTSSSSSLPPSCTSLSWNSTGSLLALSYGHLSHSGWCSHSSLLCVWNVHRRLINPSLADMTVELTSCVSSLAFHPSLPSLLAVGLHTGQIRLFDFSLPDDPLVCSSSISSLTHCEPVTSLVWSPSLYPTASTSASSLPSSYLLLSSSLDGKLLTWSLDARLAHPSQGLLCSPSPLYHGHGQSNSFPSIALTSLSLSSDHLSLVVGSQAGGVLRCIHSQRKPKGGQVKSGECKWTKDAYTLLDSAPLASKFDAKKTVEQHAIMSASAPVIDLPLLFSSPLTPALLYPPLASACHRMHDGVVSGVAFSPFHPALFLSVSTDRSVRLYKVGKEEEVWAGVVGEGGVSGWDVCWSTARPLVFAVADGEGQVGVWDLGADWARPVLMLRGEEGGKGRVGMVKLRWNNSDDGSVLAAVDSKGRAHVWQLGGKLSSLQPGEQRMLEELGAVGR